MSVEKPLGEVLFTLVMKQVLWNEVLQSSQEMLQYFTCTSATYHTGCSQSLGTPWPTQEAKASQQLQAELSSSPALDTQLGSQLKPIAGGFFQLWFNLSPSPQHLLKMLMKKGPQNNVLSISFFLTI